MAKKRKSAGLLMVRRVIVDGEEHREFLLVHPGGPFFAKKDLGAWSIPKGELEEGEDPLQAARRELTEETGLTAEGPFLPLSRVVQASGKEVVAWAFVGDCDPASIRSNAFTLEWPPGSGVRREFPEVDRAAWFGPEEARRRINPAQVTLIDEANRLTWPARP